MIATRILGYGNEYQVQMTCPSCEFKQQTTIDLGVLEHRHVDFETFPKGVNEFPFTLPSGTEITFKFLTSKDEEEVETEIKALKKVNERYATDISTRLKKVILSVNGNRDRASIVKFVDNELVAKDSLAFRRHLVKIQPGVDMVFDYVCKNPECDFEGKAAVPLTVEFFWPGGN